MRNLAALLLSTTLLPGPVFLLPNPPAFAQATDSRKAEADQLLKLCREHLQNQQYEAAIQSCQQAAENLRQRGNRNGEARAINNIGFAYRSLSQHEQAISYFQQVQPLVQALQDRNLEASVFYNLGLSHQSLFQHTQAIAYFQQALPITQALQDRNLEAWILNNLGVSYQFLSRYQQAISYHQQALSIFQALKDQNGEVWTLNNLGLVYLNFSEYQQAIDYFQKALPVFQALKNGDGEAEALNSLGNAYRFLSQYEQAISYHQNALSICRKIKSPCEANSLMQLGLAYNALSQYEQAIKGYQQALPIFQRVKDKKGEADILVSLGNVYQNLSQYEQAISYFRQALPLYQQIKNQGGEAVVLGSLGGAYYRLSQHRRAIGYYEQALPIFQAVKDRNSEATLLMRLGAAYNALVQYERALDYYQQALIIFQTVKNRNGEAQVLSNLGRVYQSLSQHERAIAYFQQALPIYQAVKDRNGEALALNNLGISYRALAQYERAIGYYKQALPILQAVKNRSGEAAALNNLGGVLYQTGQFAESEARLYASIALWESIRADAGTDENKVSIFEGQARSYRTLQQALIAQGKVEQALEVSERGRARAFVELLATKQTTVNQPPAVQPIAMAEIRQIAREQKATLVQYANIFDEQLLIYVVKPTGEITLRRIDLKPLKQEKLSLDTFVLAVRCLGVGSCEATVGSRSNPLLSFNESQSLAAAFQISDPKNIYLQALHSILIDPIADLLPKNPNERILFMPQGQLFLVPFAALQDKQGQYLIDRHTIAYAPSIQVLQLTRQQRQRLGTAKQGNMLLVGNPVMPSLIFNPANPPAQLPPLLGAEKEAKAISKMLNVPALIGKQATKAVVMKQMLSARIIHLATHGLLDDFGGGGVPGAIALAPDKPGEVNNGLLTSNELLDMKLNAELVVLSACDTGRGRITGDGVIGLSRSLITAGVPSVIVSLWAVPDAPTADLMTRFYQNLNQGQDKATALRQAMLATKKDHPDPTAWAAFVLIGESQ